MATSSSSTGGNAVAFRPDLHRRFLAGYMEKEDDSMLAFLTSHLRMGGAYWCLTCLDLLHYDINDPKVLDLEKQSQSGGAAGSGSGREAAWSRMKKFGTPGMVTTYCPPVRGVAGAPAVVDSVAVDEPGDEKKMAAKTAEDAAAPAAEKNVSERRRNADLLTEWVLDCQNPDGGFGWDRGQDSHLTACHYALQVLAMLDKMEVLEEEEDFFRDTVAPQENEREDGDTQPSSPAKIETRRGGPHGECGCFSADRWGEATPRFVYSGIAICKILGALDRINTNAAVRYLNTCYNLDGGFGTRPGSESHAAYTWYQN
eukprot:g6106.t1